MDSNLTDLQRANLRVKTQSLQLQQKDRRLSTLEAKLAQRDAEAKTTLETIRHAHYFLKEYTNDALNATHAKRVLFNALHALTTANEEKNDEG